MTVKLLSEMDIFKTAFSAPVLLAVIVSSPALLAIIVTLACPSASVMGEGVSKVLFNSDVRVIVCPPMPLSAESLSEIVRLVSVLAITAVGPDKVSVVPTTLIEILSVFGSPVVVGTLAVTIIVRLS